MSQQAVLNRFILLICFIPGHGMKGCSDNRIKSSFNKVTTEMHCLILVATHKSKYHRDDKKSRTNVGDDSSHSVANKVFSRNLKSKTY
jgi:RecA-family ATPase